MRSLFLSLVFLVGCSGPTPAPAPPPPASLSTPAAPARRPVLLVPVPDKAAEGSTRYEADWSFDIRAEDHFSVHVHVIPPGQMVPLHRHPKNWELTFVAAGEAQWTSVAEIDGELRVRDDVLTVGSAAIAPIGAAHEVRNRSDSILAAVVVHQPEFGQNWYLPRDEVTSPLQSLPFTQPVADGVPAGWAVSWEALGEHDRDRDHVVLVSSGTGTLAFEDKRLPLSVGHVASVPGGLHHTIEGSSDFRALSLLIPPNAGNP